MEKNTDLPSKTEFEGALAGVEIVLPKAKTLLPWARTTAAAWNIGHVPKHTIPMTEGPAVLSHLVRKAGIFFAY